MFIKRRSFLKFLSSFSFALPFVNKTSHINDVKYFIDGKWVSTYRIWDFRLGYVFVFSWEDDKFLFPVAITFFSIFKDPKTRQPLVNSHIYYYNEKTNVRKENKKEGKIIIGQLTFHEQLLVDIINCKHSVPQPWTIAYNFNFEEEAARLKDLQ